VEYYRTRINDRILGGIDVFFSFFVKGVYVDVCAELIDSRRRRSPCQRTYVASSIVLPRVCVRTDAISDCTSQFQRSMYTKEKALYHLFPLHVKAAHNDL